jgi:5S rRNA maturation endonuclease (ribonuclease M5)
MLEPFLVGSERPGGDWDMKCPLHKDNKRSGRVNFQKNVWVCFAGCGKGNLSGLLRRMRAQSPQPPSGKVRKQNVGGQSASIPMSQAERWHRALLADRHAMEYLWRVRAVDEESMRQFGIGYDRARQAFTIPVFNDNGQLFNVRKYRPNAGGDKKIWWAVPSGGATIPLFGMNVIADSTWVVVCEGEMDAILANQYGFPAVSGTAGASTWHLSWSEQLRDRDIIICYDRDHSGEVGARKVAESLEHYARSIYIATIPLNKKGADVSDFFMEGGTSEGFRHVLKRAKPFQKRITDPMSMEPFKVSVMDSFDSQNIGRALSMDVLISGRSKEPYSLPKVVTSTCTMDAGNQCSICPMRAAGGRMNYEIQPSSPTLLEMLESNKTAQQDALRQYIKAAKCNRLEHEVKSYQTVEQLYVRPSWDEESGDFTPRLVNSVGKHNTMPSQVVTVTGTTWPDPKEQKNELLAWNVQETENAIDEFRVTPEIVSRLKVFQPKGRQSPLQKLVEVAKDYEQHVTRIYGRLDLHVAVMLVYHSVITFPFQDKVERRGWLDALVVGDTRTGKSEVSQRLLEQYRLGQFVNCEAATFAGIVGGLQQMADRQWAVTWGIIPMSDRRLVVLDEASGLSFENIQAMSDVRSRGFVRLQKIQAEQAWARTRLLWLSNPRDSSMERYTYGIQAIEPLIGNREDIARFDFAMALTQHDVSMEDIYQVPSRDEPQYSAEDAQTLVMWAWSRQAEDIRWEFGAEDDVFTAAGWLGQEYVGDPPLLQAANAHVKVARIAVAMAAATFSTDRTGKHIVVKRAHVVSALKFLHSLYKKETFGYHRLSERMHDQAERAEESIDDAQRWLLENRMMIDFLQQVEGQFRREMVEQMLNVSREEANALVQKMFYWGLVSPNGYAVKMTPALHSLLRHIEQEDGR